MLIDNPDNYAQIPEPTPEGLPLEFQARFAIERAAILNADIEQLRHLYLWQLKKVLIKEAILRRLEVD